MADARVQILTLAVAVTIGLETRYGLGRHFWTMPPENSAPYLKVFYASIVIYNLATPLVKISLLLMYKRIFASPTMQRVCFFALIFMVGYAISFPLALALSCIPVPKFWDQSIPGRCIEQHLADPIMGAVNIATDIFLLCLPMPAIKSLQLPRRQKRLLYGVFCLSFLWVPPSCIPFRSSTTDLLQHHRHRALPAQTSRGIHEDP
jgi:hypothetical protein